MRVLITGANGVVGRFIVADLAARGHEIIRLGRAGEIVWRLGKGCALPVADGLIHCAFDHLPGAYRGGEGQDPEGFWRRNFDGTARLAEEARRAGARSFVFLSSRAVYDGAETLDEDARLAPTSLYGRLKLETERMLDALAGPEFVPVALRATGVCGLAPGSREHKWQELFEDFRAGRPVAPRAATEVHGTDLAEAVRMLLERRVRGAFNASDIILDRRDLLGEVARLTGCAHPLPQRDATPARAMPTERLRALGWAPSGRARLWADLPEMLG